MDEKLLPIEGAGIEELQTLYSWGTDEAISAQKKWDRAKHGEFAVGPFHRWLAAQELLLIGEAYLKEPDKRLIMEGLYLCTYRDLPIPRWCSMAFLERYRHVRQYNAKSWDDAFGRPHPKGAHLATLRENWIMELKVYRRIKEIKKESPGTPIDGYLFEQIGKEFGIGGKTKTETLYYAAKKRLKIDT